MNKLSSYRIGRSRSVDDHIYDAPHILRSRCTTTTSPPRGKIQLTLLTRILVAVLSKILKQENPGERYSSRLQKRGVKLAPARSFPKHQTPRRTEAAVGKILSLGHDAL